MHFANLWGFLGLLALPIIAYIHMYHRRFPTLEIAGAHLWGVESQQTVAGRKRENLPITKSLLLELLAALLITLLIAQPRLSDSTGVPHLVVVLDNSASMSATPGGNTPSFREQAIKKIKEKMDTLGRKSVVTIITTGRRPSMIAGPAFRWTEAETELKKWNPELPQHQFVPAWDLGAQFAENADELVFLTDHAPGKNENVPDRMEVISVGRKLSNVAFSAARWDFDSQTRKGKVFFRIANLGKETTKVQLVGESTKTEKDQQLFSETFSLKAGEEKPLRYTVPGGLGTIVATLSSTRDHLKLDNQVTLVEPYPRILTVVVKYPRDTLERSLFQRIVQSMPDIQPGSLADADLIIGPASKDPPKQPESWWLGVGPLKKDDAIKKKAKLLKGPFLMEKRNPLLSGVVLGGIVWGGVQPTQATGAPLISSGSHALLFSTHNNAGENYLMNIDLNRSNISESPDLPILISNFITECRNSRPGLQRWNYRMNETIQFRIKPFVPTEKNKEEPILKLALGETKRELARIQNIELPPLEKAGIYTILDGDENIGRFAVNFFDREESNLANLLPVIKEKKGILDGSASEKKQWEIENPFTLAILLALAAVLLALFANWYVLNPSKK